MRFIACLACFLNAPVYFLFAQSPSVPENAIVPSDFLLGNLGSINTDTEDPMGTQRLIQVKSSSITPVVNASTSFKYTSNPDKAKVPTRKDATALDLSLNLNVGLGEYGIGDDVLSVPALTIMQMRTFNDPVKDYGKEMQIYDVDVRVIGLSLPFVLPNDFTLTIGHAYVAPSTFQGKNEVISTSNTPSFVLAKNFPLSTGDIISFTVGASYTFSSGDTLKEQFLAAATTPAEAAQQLTYYNFLEAVMGGSSVVNSNYPSNLQDGIAHTISLSYLSPFNDKLMLVPNFVYNNMMFTEGINKNRSDRTYSLGVTASYAVYEWLNASVMMNYTWKTSSDNVSEYEDFLGGVSFGVTHAF